MYIDEKKYWRYKTADAFDSDEDVSGYVNSFLSRPSMATFRNTKSTVKQVAKPTLTRKQERDMLAQKQEEEWELHHPKAPSRLDAANVAASIERQQKEIRDMATATEPKILSRADETELKDIVDKKASDSFADTVASLIDKNLLSAGSVVKRKTALELAKFAFKLGLKYAKEGESITKYIKK